MSTSDDTPLVSAQLQPPTAKLGDLLTLELQVTYPNGDQLKPLDWKQPLGTFEVYASTGFPLDVRGGQTVARFQAQLQNFTTGQQTLPSIEIAYEDLSRTVRGVKTPELKATIEAFPLGPKDKGELRGIKGVIGPVAHSPWWWVLLLILVIVAVVYLWQKRQRVLHGPPPPPPVAPDEDALQKLERLRASGWLETGRVKEFYSGLSDIMRGYVETAFKIPALERTTAELMRDARKRTEIRSQELAQLQALLESCDLVKFAKFRPEPAEALQEHGTAVQWVGSTRVLLRRETP